MRDIMQMAMATQTVMAATTGNWPQLMICHHSATARSPRRQVIGIQTHSIYIANLLEALDMLSLSCSLFAQ